MGAIDVVTSGIEDVIPHIQLIALRKEPELPMPFEPMRLNRAADFLTSDVIKADSRSKTFKKDDY
jgi:hypothetical protein